MAFGIELFLNATRFAASKEARDSATALVALLKSTPEWKRDYLALKIKIKRKHWSRVTLLSDAVASKLSELGYSDECIHSFNTVSHELTQNLRKHGLRSENSAAKIVWEVSPTYVSITTINPRGLPMELGDLMGKAERALSETPFAGGGRGLLLISKVADEFRDLGKASLVATLYRDRVVIDVLNHDEITIIRLVSGHKNPSAGRRLLELIDDLAPDKLILDFGGSLAAESVADHSPEYVRMFGHRFNRLVSGHTGDTTAVMTMLPSFEEKQRAWRIVCPNPSMRKLLPSTITTATLQHAMDELRVVGLDDRV